VSEAEALFSEEELSVICLNVTKRSAQKYHVPLGSDIAMATD
jgi:hypothetical protein